MLWQAELERLRQERERLVVECDARRALLALEWRLSRSPQGWWTVGSAAVRRHPLLAVALGVALGWLGLKLGRRPGGVWSSLGRLGRLGALLWALWNRSRRS